MSKEKKPTPPGSNNGASPAACITTECPHALKNSMSQTEAKDFITKFKNTNIPFDYPPDCCYARARVMTDMMEKQGFASNKLWSEGRLAAQKSNGDAVTFPDKNGNPKAVTWHYHVAPIVNVEQPDGSVAKRILDPSLSDKPLSVDEWKKLCGASPPKTTEDITTPPGKHYPFNKDTKDTDYSVDQAEKDLQVHRDTRDINRAAAAEKNQ